MNEQKESNGGSSSALTTTEHRTPTTSLNALNLFDKNQLAAAEAFLTRIMRSDKGGIKTVNDGLAIMMRANDLQLPFSTCIEHIHVINGKTGVDVHIIKALLSRAGVTWRCTLDYAPQYQYTDGDNVYNETQLPTYCVKCSSAKEAEAATKEDVVGVYPLRWYADLKGNVYNQFGLNDKCVIALNKIQALKLASEGKFPVVRIAARPIDYVTEFKFTRYFTINGKERVQEAISHFSYSEAQAADMFSKDTYKKYPRIMVGHRAFVYGARDIASDLLMGVMETTELKSIEGIDLAPEDYTYIEVPDTAGNAGSDFDKDGQNN
jgi:hypothetical protein